LIDGSDECKKDTRILEWFGPLERNTLRPLGYVLLEKAWIEPELEM
jgi:hypothetical protein